LKTYDAVIIGAGPAGLAAGYELVQKQIQTVVLEQSDKVGGIARTEVYKDYRFDIGGHRFYTKNAEIQKLWEEVIGKDFIKVPRLSRIYYRGKYFDYPLSLFNTLINLGLLESILVFFSYLKARIRANLGMFPEPETFEDWVTFCFGHRLYKIFFKTYTEKVWGIPCNKIQAEWARQRIQGITLKSAVLNAVFGSHQAKSLIKQFDYPILGPGMMWERFQEEINRGAGEVLLNTSVTKIERSEYHIKSISIHQDGEEKEIVGNQFISSMPITALVHRLNPPAPQEVLDAARSLSYRDFLIVPLIINVENLFEDNWIYIHTPDVKVGRIQNFKNWSLAMVPDPSKTCLGMEYFCSEGDEIWELSDKELIALATRELAQLGLVDASKVEDGTVLRQKKAYPVYDRNYRQHLRVIEQFLANFDNLQTVGRNGMHRYNNQDHSMLTGLLAAKNVLGEAHDLWEVNTERSYYEEFTKEEQNEFESKIPYEKAFSG
jgi:protoporphyrinogen oxidase